MNCNNLHYTQINKKVKSYFLCVCVWGGGGGGGGGRGGRGGLKDGCVGGIKDGCVSFSNRKTDLDFRDCFLIKTV